MPSPAIAVAAGSGLVLAFDGKACWYRGSALGAGGAASIASVGRLSSSLESALLLRPFRLLRASRSCHSSSRASAGKISGFLRRGMAVHRTSNLFGLICKFLYLLSRKDAKNNNIIIPFFISFMGRF
jgi:hypothetical protein